MKYGERLEDESVPEWSLNNVDYNALKHKIKANTTQNQGDAIAIPGQETTALGRFEDDLYNDLVTEHHRINLFVASKHAEIERRLKYYSEKVERFCKKSHEQCLRDEPSKKRQRLATKYERELVNCAEDLRSLSRFIAAQLKAFNKILKKYRKWTRSDKLGRTFKQGVLSKPSSFSKFDCSQLQVECEEILAKLRAASPPQTAAPTPIEVPDDEASYYRRDLEAAPRSQPQPEQIHYWNEYDDGSENGDDAGYYIYTDAPDDDDTAPFTLKSVMGALATPIKELFSPSSPPRKRSNRHPERRRLLSQSSLDGYGTNATDQRTLIASSTDNTDAENDSDDPFTPDNGFASDSSTYRFPGGYSTHHASFPSVADQRHRIARERLLGRGAVGSFAAAVVLLSVAALLFATGRHKLRAEVDAGAAVGVVGSLGFACTALGLTMARSHPGGWVETGIIWIVFAAICVANGMLLVLLVGS